MNSLYHRFAIASVGIALSLALGTDKQAKAATITLTPLQFSTVDQDRNGRGDWYSAVPYGLEFRLSRSKSAITVRLANSSQERQWSLATSYQAQP